MLSLKLSNLSLTGRFGNISILLILSLIASMAFVRNALLVIFPISLTLGPPLFSISVNLLFSGRSIVTVVDDHRSSFKSINSGVSQDSVLSPTLFLLFINDLFLYYPIS